MMIFFVVVLWWLFSILVTFIMVGMIRAKEIKENKEIFSNLFPSEIFYLFGVLGVGPAILFVMLFVIFMDHLEYILPTLNDFLASFFLPKESKLNDLSVEDLEALIEQKKRKK